MKITVRSFANIRDAIGSRIVSLEVPEDSDIASCLQIIAEKYPLVRQLLFDGSNLSSSIKIAVDSENIDDLHTVLQDGQQLALIPPTGGG